MSTSVPGLGVPSLGVPGSMILGSAGTAGVIGSTPDGPYVVSFTDITLPTRQTTRHFGRAALGTT